jgi:hypothetical protein
MSCFTKPDAERERQNVLTHRWHPKALAIAISDIATSLFPDGLSVQPGNDDAAQHGHCQSPAWFRGGIALFYGSADEWSSPFSDSRFTVHRALAPARLPQSSKAAFPWQQNLAHTDERFRGINPAPRDSAPVATGESLPRPDGQSDHASRGVTLPVRLFSTIPCAEFGHRPGPYG